jgi:hypothetical protein
MIILAPISVGELIDKITILEIKQQKILDPYKKQHVNTELDELTSILDSLNKLPAEIDELREQLYHINGSLWMIEDFKRECERNSKFNIEFIEAARLVYKKNDQRADIKRQINYLTESTITEVKSHTKY